MCFETAPLGLDKKKGRVRCAKKWTWGQGFQIDCLSCLFGFHPWSAFGHSRPFFAVAVCLFSTGGGSLRNLWHCRRIGKLGQGPNWFWNNQPPIWKRRKKGAYNPPSLHDGPKVRDGPPGPFEHFKRSKKIPSGTDGGRQMTGTWGVGPNYFPTECLEILSCPATDSKRARGG